MSSALVFIDDLVPMPVDGGWRYVRSWFSVGHFQSGVEWHLAIGQYNMMSEDEAAAEVDRLGLYGVADHEIFQQWQNPTGVLH